MSKSRFLFQAIREDSHADEILHVLAVPKVLQALISSAYVSSSGVSAIAAQAAGLGKKLSVYAGIRNGTTSAQALSLLVDSGVRLFAVDTASQSIIFHPKLYLGIGEQQARLVIGSANLTGGGLAGNVEAGLALSLDLGKADDKALVDDICDAFAEMRKEHPKHVFRLKTQAAIDALLAQGRLVDETVARPKPASGTATNVERDSLPPMKLHRKNLGLRPVNKPVTSHATTATQAVKGDWQKVWQSSPLSERDLNIPSRTKTTGKKTNPTGSIGLDQGSYEREIDQRHYFYTEVFSALKWRPDTNKDKSHLHRATGRFELMIKGIDSGRFNLRLSHNIRTDTESYRQSNSMTSLHWKEVKPLIAQRDLLERTLTLFQNTEQTDLYRIVID